MKGDDCSKSKESDNRPIIPLCKNHHRETLVCGFCYDHIKKEKVWRCGDAPEIFCKKECGLRFMKLKKQSVDKSMDDYAVRDVQEMLLNEYGK